MAFTDPAKELAETLALIVAEPNEKVAARISNRADVDQWSPEFFRILFEIVNRMDLVLGKISELPMDDDIKEDAISSVIKMRAVFTSPKIISHDNNQVKPVLSGSNATVLRMLSMMIREKVSYPLLEDEDRRQVIEEVLQLKEWLVELQSDDRDFIRQALIDGVDGFLFRLERLEWLGHGYVLDGLREVIKAYITIQGARIPDDGGTELQDAILMKTKASITRILEIFDLAKDNSDRADWALRTYGAVSALSDGSTTVAGLLS